MWYQKNSEPLDRSTENTPEFALHSLSNYHFINILFYIFFLNRGIILWLELIWSENPENTYVQHTETLDSCFDLIRSHQQCITWSPPLEIEPATTDSRAEIPQLSHQFISHTSDPKLTSHGNCSGQLTWMRLASYIRTLYKGHGHLQGHVFPRGLEIRIRIIIITSRGARI